MNLKLTLEFFCLGRYETEHSDPMAGMSDEQKEYEAIQLLNAMDRLQRLGEYLEWCPMFEDSIPSRMLIYRELNLTS